MLAPVCSFEQLRSQIVQLVALRERVANLPKPGVRVHSERLNGCHVDNDEQSGLFRRLGRVSFLLLRLLERAIGLWARRLSGAGLWRRSRRFFCFFSAADHKRREEQCE